ncbi:vacuolar segregation protein PEP7-like [Dendronephthya gigantea]|uniref:vacuolar segregation protein PEP7-like n=1 Tax=Dendronephthya gigantea TaxID=151771 RepID=UPI00106D82B5|nr:vacuolar segregation protein PEP7-like [Dendronephthya gigantea]
MASGLLSSKSRCGFDSDWNDVSASIDLFLVEHERKLDEGRLRFITKSHWISDKERKQCANKLCKVNFSLTERKHHCRRCGEIFCHKCTSFTQRLSLLAQRDPDGILYKVCILCFNREGQLFGKTRSRMKEFQESRSQTLQKGRDATDFVDCDITSTISHRLARLTCKYQEHVTEEKPSMVDLVTVPLWQIPKNGLKNLRYCYLCTKKFNFLRPAHHCRICGEAVCLECSSEELLLYCDAISGISCWAILDVAGCPPEPPETRECLRLCASCHSHAVHIQVQNMIKERQDNEGTVLKNVQKYYDQLMKLKLKINEVLTKYQELVNAIEHERDLTNIIPKGGSTTKILAKYNSDTSDLFTQFAIDMQGFKKVKPKTTSQLQLVSSIINAMYGYYSKNFYTFRDLQRSLETTLGYRALESVQFIVDYQTINCTFLALKQLGLECLELSQKYNIDSHMVSLLALCEDVCKRDLQEAVKSSGEDWNKHEESTRQFVKLQLKEKKLLICLKKTKSTEMEKLVLQKCDLFLLKVERQLNAKARVNKFTRTKESLQTTKVQIEELSSKMEK